MEEAKGVKENRRKKMKIKWRQPWADLRTERRVSGFGVVEESIKMVREKSRGDIRT